ncbi:putative L,D-transpeptidase YkuD [Sporotomaculum syntrophicum]|uniref:L,D-transpeptidase YkuD n=1 Tax=Sporotomaculum syntrophicum TaxID=182264 RepID=A0A9D2WML3_9FIRM|nr:L,D-transpeptidase [Sporotomaculum syntrophicum]KAF1084054.1 putative L,D-transpeptidase YkuD [Sporotomaculum syntrophicum]
MQKFLNLRGAKYLIVLLIIMTIGLFDHLNIKQEVHHKPIPQNKLPIPYSIHTVKDKQKIAPAPTNTKQGYVIFENDQVAVYRNEQMADIVNKQTGQRIRVYRGGTVHNIIGKSANKPPLVGDTIAEGIKLVCYDEITIIGIKPEFKVISTYPNPRTGSDKIIINKKNNTLYLYKEGELYKSYPVATGENPLFTPEGVFKIANKIENHGQELKPQLGVRWLGLAVPFEKDNRAEKDARAPVGRKYGIHGTNEPDSIGKYASGGCIRMDNRQIAELFKLVEVNTPVEIRHW